MLLCRDALNIDRRLKSHRECSWSTSSTFKTEVAALVQLNDRKCSTGVRGACRWIRRQAADLRDGAVRNGEGVVLVQSRRLFHDLLIYRAIIDLCYVPGNKKCRSVAAWASLAPVT